MTEEDLAAELIKNIREVMVMTLESNSNFLEKWTHNHFLSFMVYVQIKVNTFLIDLVFSQVEITSKEGFVEMITDHIKSDLLEFINKNENNEEWKEA